MKTITIKLYKFEELSKEAQEKAIDKNYDININDYWYEYILEDFEENENIFENIKVYFSGFYSQGDGSMMEYKGINKDIFKTFLNEKTNFTEKRKQLIFDNIYISAKGTQKGHYYNENSCYHSIDIELNQGYTHYKHSNIYNLIIKLNEDFESYLIEIYKNKCRELYKNLNNCYDYLTSKEEIKESLISNNYEFTEDGEIY